MTAATKAIEGGRLRPNERLGGKYSLLRRLAVGGMGEIWVARNEMTGAEVALKVLRPELGTKIEVEPRFRNEARLGAMLTHRNIIRIFDLLEEPDGSLVLVMELLRGETLRDFLRRKKPLEAKEAVAIILQLLSGLQHAHEMGIVHRDLKPANIILAVDPDGQVTPKLLDFGIAKLPAAGQHTLDGRVLGTPRYMSPEQIRSDPKIDGRSDVFSAAVLLVEMLTGTSPFNAKTPSASLAAVLETQIDPDPRIDPQLWIAIQRALAKRAYERYANASEFADALRRAVDLTDAESAAILRREKPSTRAPSEGDPPSGESEAPIAEPSVALDSDDVAPISNLLSDSHAPAGVPAPRRPRHVLIAGAVGVAAIGVLLAVTLLHGGSHGDEKANAQPSASSSAAVGAAPTASVVELGGPEIPNPPPPETSATAAAPATGAPPAGTTPPRTIRHGKKPTTKRHDVATNPGF